MTGDGSGADHESEVSAREKRPDGGRPTLDVILKALASQRRRYALYLLQEETTATLREVATQVAARENGCPVEKVGCDHVDSIYVDFCHRHLPKLADANVVQYDPREERVRYDCPKVAEHLLEVTRLVESPDETG